MNSRILSPLLYWIYDKRWLLAAGLIVLMLNLLPHPPGLTTLGWRTLTLALAVIVLIITEPVPLPAIALFIAVMQVLFGIGTPNEVASTFLSDAVVFIIGSLMLAVVMVKQQLDRRLAYIIIRITGAKVQRITLGFVSVSALMASFIGEHTVAAIMLPVAVSLIRHVEAEHDEVNGTGLAPLLLLAIAFGCAVGGLGTPSGGARNAIMIDLWNRLYHRQVSYGQWILYAYPLGLLHIPVLTWVLRRTFFPERASLSRAVAALRRKVSDQGHFRGREYLAVGIFGLAFLLWVLFSDRIGLGAPALIAVFLAIAFGLVDWNDINAGVNWGVVLIYASTISLGVAFKHTGAGEWLAEELQAGLTLMGLNNRLVVIGMIVGITMGVANLIGHGPAVALFGPIALIIAQRMGIDYLVAGFVTVAASSYSFLTVMGSPASTIVYSSGDVDTRHFLKAGLRVTMASIGLIYLMRYTYWMILP